MCVYGGLAYENCTIDSSEYVCIIYLLKQMS